MKVILYQSKLIFKVDDNSRKEIKGIGPNAMYTWGIETFKYPKELSAGNEYGIMLYLGKKKLLIKLI